MLAYPCDEDGSGVPKELESESTLLALLLRGLVVLLKARLLLLTLLALMLLAPSILCISGLRAKEDGDAKGESNIEDLDGVPRGAGERGARVENEEVGVSEGEPLARPL